MSVKNLTVDKDNAKRRLDNLLMSIYKELPRSKIYSMIRKGEVRVNSGRTKPLYKVREGDIIRIPPYLNNESKPKKSISNKLQDKKIESLMQGEPELILTANIGCLKHLQRNSPVPVKHWIEEVAASIR